MGILRFILLNTDPGLTTVFCFLIGVLLLLAVTGAVKESDDATVMDLAFLYVRRCAMILIFACGPLLVVGMYIYAYSVYGYDGDRASQFMSLWYGEFRKSIADLWWCFLVVLSAPMFLHQIVDYSMRSNNADHLQEVQQLARLVQSIRRNRLHKNQDPRNIQHLIYAHFRNSKLYI